MKKLNISIKYIIVALILLLSFSCASSKSAPEATNSAYTKLEEAVAESNVALPLTYDSGIVLQRISLRTYDVVLQWILPEGIGPAESEEERERVQSELRKQMEANFSSDPNLPVFRKAKANLYYYYYTQDLELVYDVVMKWGEY